VRARSAGLLSDILDECDFLMDNAYGVTLEQYQSDEVLHRSIERAFEIIGEAAHKLHDSDPGTARRLPNARGLVAFRNLIIHGYNRIDDERLLDTLERDVPALRDAVRELLGSRHRSARERQREAPHYRPD